MCCGPAMGGCDYWCYWWRHHHPQCPPLWQDACWWPSWRYFSPWSGWHLGEYRRPALLTWASFQIITLNSSCFPRVCFLLASSWVRSHMEVSMANSLGFSTVVAGSPWNGSSLLFYVSLPGQLQALLSFLLWVPALTSNTHHGIISIYTKAILLVYRFLLSFLDLACVSLLRMNSWALITLNTSLAREPLRWAQCNT